MTTPDRRLAPRPLPAHLAAAATLWASSRAGLTSWKAGSRPSNSGLESRLHQLIEEIERAGKSEVRAALDGELTRRAGAFLGGVETYRAHHYRRPPSRKPVLWREGTTRLIDYGRGRGGLPVLAIPSLVNRYYVLDLLRECSFLRHLAGAGLRPLVIDWDAPGPEERAFSMSDYIAGRLDRALDAAVAAAGRPVALVGYCMGGLLALALALRRPAETACLALLATPWDFHADRPEQATRLAAMIEAMLLGPHDVPLAVDPIQMLFWSLDPLLAERKFVRFAGLDPGSRAARVFVALEDWLNDGVPLARNVARECARDWYGANLPALGEWRVGGAPVLPQNFDKPALIVLPSRDRIVPPRSAEPLGAALPNATVLRPPLGHIGMMVGADAPQAVWQPIAAWLRTQLRA